MNSSTRYSLRIFNLKCFYDFNHSIFSMKRILSLNPNFHCFYTHSPFKLAEANVSSPEASENNLNFDSENFFQNMNSNFSTESKNSNFLSHYDSLVERNILQADSAQRHVARVLSTLCEELKDYQQKMKIYHTEINEWNEKRKQMRIELIKEDERKEEERKMMKEERRKKFEIITRWFAKKRKSTPESGVGRRIERLKREKEINSKFPLTFHFPSSPKSIYLYGSVGCGKTLLMDVFHDYIKPYVSKCIRIHFNAAMLDIHSKMHKEFLKEKEIKNNTNNKINNTINNTMKNQNDEKKYEILAEEEINELKNFNIFEKIGEKMIKNDANNFGACVICFDEIQIIDVFTALLISKLFDYFIKKGVIIISTSNKSLLDLNKDGFQKEIFSEFINRYSKNCNQLLIQSTIDYRRINAKIFFSNNNSTTHYFYPKNEKNKLQFENLWKSMLSQTSSFSDGQTAADSKTKIQKVTIPVLFGRELEVFESLNGIAKFSFQFLCSNPLGSADYLSIAQSFHTIFLYSIPIMSEKNKDEARRFITLIDELYNNKCRLICLSEASIDDLFSISKEDENIIDYESIQFETEVEKKSMRKNVLKKENSFSALNSNAALQNLLKGKQEEFAFKRAISRLIEMQTPTYHLLRPYIE